MEKCPECKRVVEVDVVAVTEGPNAGKSFKHCPACGALLGEVK